MRTLMLGVALAACSPAPPAQTPPPQVDTHAQPESIGSATMEADGTIVLQLRAEDGAGSVGDALLRYPPTHAQYRSILEHVGADMRPGETRSVRPFPEQ